MESPNRPPGLHREFGGGFFPRFPQSQPEDFHVTIILTDKTLKQAYRGGGTAAVGSVDFRSSWRLLRRRIPRSSATRHPRGDCRGPEEGFYRRFPSSRRGIYSFTPLYSHTHRRWGRIGSRGRTADRARAVGAGVRDSSCTAGSCVRVRVLPTLRQRCAIPSV